MFKELKKLKYDIDISTSHLSKAQTIKYLVTSHTFHLVFLIRIASSFNKIFFIGGLLRWLIEYIIRVVYSSDISCKASIDGGLNIMHGHDIVIGSGVIIGKNAKIFNGITLGNKDTESSLIAQPEIGNNVIISTGAKVLGNIRVGDFSIIGANSVVIKSIPSKEIWAGVPAKKIGERTHD